MTDIKLVLTDMDGTVVLHDKHEVSEAVRDAVIAAEDSGIAVTAVTGRPFEMAQPVLNVLGFDGLCVVDGGATIRNAKTGEMVWTKWLTPATIKDLVSILLPHADKVDFSPTWLEQAAETVDLNIPFVTAPYVYARLPTNLVPAMNQALAPIKDLAIFSYPSAKRIGYSGFQISHAKADKEHGVAALLKLLGIDKAHVMAIGDGSNDMPLFRAAGLKVAMGNASDELKAAADHVVARVEDDGFAEAVQRFVIN